MRRSQALIGVAALVAGSSLLAPMAHSSPASAPSVPPGFVASSTSWTTTANGWVLGFAPCPQDARQRCGTLLHTTDGGATWKRATVPGVRVSPRFRQVKIAFAAHTAGSGPAMGLASDGKRLFETLDGAQTWLPVSLGVNPSIGDVAYTLHAAYAIVGTGTVDGGRTAMYTTERGKNDWYAEPKVHIAGNGVNVDGGYDLATRGDDGAVAIGRIFVDIGYWTTSDGYAWTRHPSPCTRDQLPGLNWVGPHKVVATCSYDPGMSKQLKDVRLSVDGGEFSTTSSAPIDLFTTTTSAATPERPFIGATAAGVAWLYGTFDDGDTWKTVLRVNDELPYYDLQFPNRQHGFVVSGGSAYDRGAVYATADGGKTWHPLDLG